jgi:hypothetical protein
MRIVLAGLALAFIAAVPARAGTAELAPLLDGVHWGQSAAELAQHFGARALKVAPPIEFGDSYVDVALRDQRLGGYGFVVYFQMGKDSHRLMRIMLERQRHGANPMVFRAVLAALQRDYGQAAASCHAPAERQSGFQETGEHRWHDGERTIRAVFSDTTLEAESGCTTLTSGACGLTGHLYVQIFPRASEEPACR